MKKIILILSIFFMLSGCKSVGLGKNSSSKLSNVELDTSNINEKKYISDWFKKKE